MSNACRIVTVRPAGGRLEAWLIVFPDKIVYHEEADGLSFLNNSREFEKEMSFAEVQDKYPHKAKEVEQLQRILRFKEVVTGEKRLQAH